MKMLRAVLTLFLTPLLGPACWASPYWVDYEASSGQFPEEQGWTRIVYGGGAQRSFDNGALVIDSRGGTGIEDVSRMERPGSMDPGPGEVFVMQWRLRVDELLQGTFDPGVSVYSDGQTGVMLAFALDHIVSPSEYGTIATFTPGVSHDYELRSPDMLDYQLKIDGVVVHNGTFYYPGNRSRVSWGDQWGGSSLSDWESFRFGVLPEPDGVWLVLSASLAVLRCARTRRA